MESEKRRGKNLRCLFFRILWTGCLHIITIIDRFVCIFWPARFGILNRLLGLHVHAQPRPPSNAGQDYAMSVGENKNKQNEEEKKKRKKNDLIKLINKFQNLNLCRHSGLFCKVQLVIPSLNCNTVQSYIRPIIGL